MEASTLSPEFFARPVLTVAPQLLGCRLHAPGGSGIIAETEAYDGEQDLACHARFGRTPRTEVMYGPAAHWYVYFVYGMHWMLNIVTGAEGYPSAVLIRTVGEAKGPGRLTQKFGIDARFNGKPAAPAAGLWITPREEDIDVRRIAATPRIGVEYAGEWAAKPFRYVLQP